MEKTKLNPEDQKTLDKITQNKQKRRQILDLTKEYIGEADDAKQRVAMLGDLIVSSFGNLLLNEEIIITLAGVIAAMKSSVNDPATEDLFVEELFRGIRVSLKHITIKKERN